MKSKLDVLIYLGENQQKENSIKNVLDTMNFNYKFLSSKDLNSTIASLFELEPTVSNNSTYEQINEDFMLFQEMSDENIIEISKQLNEIGHNVSRKAMLTETNKDWILFDLMNEIKEEHHYFNIRGELIQKIQEVMKKDPSTISSVMQKLVLEAYDAVQQQTPIEELERLLQTIKEDRKRWDS